jgi:hypothetical protein
MPAAFSFFHIFICGLDLYFECSRGISQGFPIASYWGNDLANLAKGCPSNSLATCQYNGGIPNGTLLAVMPEIC